METDKPAPIPSYYPTGHMPYERENEIWNKDGIVNKKELEELQKEIELHHEIGRRFLSGDKVARMQSPPLIFNPYITVKQWANLSDNDQDKLVEAARVLAKIKKP